MPGVKAILTADELPAPADSVTDNGAVIKANTQGERALTNEPVYQGEPILAVAAVDELTAAEAIEKIDIEFEPLPFVVDPLDQPAAGRPERADRRQCLDPATGAAASRASSRASPPPPEVRRLKWTEAEFAELKEGRLPMGKATDEWSYGDLEPASRTPRWCSTRPSSRPTPATRRSRPARRWPTGRTASCTCTPARRARCRPLPAIARWFDIDPNNVVLISEYTGGGFGSKITGDISLIIPALLSKKANAPVMMRITREEEHYIGRARPGFQGRMKVGFAQGRPHHRARHVRDRRQRSRTSGRATPAHRASSSRCCISRRRCAAAASRC